MNTRKLIAPALAALMIAGAATPASAAPWHHRSDLRYELKQMDRQIDHAYARGLLTRAEVNRLERRVDQVHRLYYNFSRNGISRGEAVALDNRMRSLRNLFAREMRDSQWRYDRDQRYDRYDRYDRQYRR